MMDIDIEAMLRRRVGDLVDEETMLDYVMIAQHIILQRRYGLIDNYPDVFPDRYLITCFQIALYLINRDGSEGQLSHNEGGIVRTYKNANIPEDLLVDVTPYGDIL